MKNLYLHFAFAGLITLMATPTGAMVITFNAHGDDGGITAVDSGYGFNFNAQGWGIYTNGFNGGFGYVLNGTTRIVMSGGKSQPYCYLTFAPTDNSVFALASIDSATFFTNTQGGARLIGNVHGGGTVTTDIALASSFQHYVLPASFTNLDSVQVRNLVSGDYEADSGVSLDNIEVNAVPEPATLLSVGTALAILVRRRRLNRN